MTEAEFLAAVRAWRRELERTLRERMDVALNEALITKGVIAIARFERWGEGRHVSSGDLRRRRTRGRAGGNRPAGWKARRPRDAVGAARPPAASRRVVARGCPEIVPGDRVGGADQPGGRPGTFSPAAIGERRAPAPAARDPAGGRASFDAELDRDEALKRVRREAAEIQSWQRRLTPRARRATRRPSDEPPFDAERDRQDEALETWPRRR